MDDNRDSLHPGAPIALVLAFAMTIIAGGLCGFAAWLAGLL